jgi:hypothetical protein
MNKSTAGLQIRFCWWRYQIVTAALLVLLSLLLAGCGPLQTQLAARFFATPTATSALTPTPTATVTPTATPTLTPTSTATPVPDAIVLSKTLKVYAGPGTKYAQVGHISKNEELDIIGQSANCAWLQAKSRSHAITGWIPAGKKTIQPQPTCAGIPPGTYRPSTGVIKALSKNSGYGQLIVDNNGSDQDGIVILTSNKKSVAAAYIRAGKTFTLKGIPDKTYELYFSTGSDWNGKAFLTNPSYLLVEDKFKFTTKVTASSTMRTTRYTKWSISLKPVAGGTAKADYINESDFPDLEN